MNHAARVRECADALKAAIAEARAAGYRVDGVGNLVDIAVSATDAVQAEPEKPKTFYSAKKKD